MGSEWTTTTGDEDCPGVATATGKESLVMGVVEISDCQPERGARYQDRWPVSSGVVGGALWARPVLAHRLTADQAVPSSRASDHRVWWPLYAASLVTADHVIPTKAGIQRDTGFRVKPGMTTRA